MYCTEKNSRIEDASRTVWGGGLVPNFPSVPQEPVFCTECL